MRAFQFRRLEDIFIACGTKFGKSISACNGLTNPFLTTPGGKFRWIAPIYRQAKIGMDYFQKTLPPAPHTKIIGSKMSIQAPKIKSDIEFWHTKDPVSLEGGGVHGQVGDEAAKMPYAAYISAKTTTTFTRGLSMWISTPYGKNWFYKKFMEAKEHQEWAFAKGIQPTMMAIQAPTIANPFIRQEVIDAAQRNLPRRLFEQYYLAQFVDDGSVFIGFRDCVRGPEIELDGNIQYWFSKDIEKAEEVVVGIDWAKHQDYTVFYALDTSGDKMKTLAFMRFQGIGYKEQIKELYHFLKRFKQIGLAYHDKTGVGEALDDMVAHLPFNIVGINFTNPIKSNIVNNLGLAFEKRIIELPNWPEMLKELDSFEVQTNKLGTAIYNAAQGMHDDIVMAMGLANLAASEYGGGMDIKFLEDMSGETEVVDDYLNELTDDYDDDY